MNRKRWTVVRRSAAVGVLLALGLSTAQAEDEDYARQGYYLGLTLAVPRANFGCSDWLRVEGSGCSDVEKYGSGLEVVAGYRGTERAAVELEMEWSQGFDVGDSAAELYTLAWTLNGKLHLLTGRIQPFLMYGLGLMRAARDGVSDTDFALRGGGGVDLYLSENTAVAAETEYVFPVGGVKNLDYVSIGLALKYRF